MSASLVGSEMCIRDSSLVMNSRWALAADTRLTTSCLSARGRLTWTSKPHQSVHGGLPISRYGLREATSLIALARSPGRSKFHDWPPGPGR
eukprot:9404610-Alexandrium_andersonii.AAC.1